MAGTREGVLMVESEASSLSEDVMLGAVMFGHDSNQIVIDAIIELAEACAKEPRAIAPEAPEVQLVKDKLHEAIREDLQEAYKVADKVARQELVTAAKEKGLALLETEDELNVAGDVLKAIFKCQSDSPIETGFFGTMYCGKTDPYSFAQKLKYRIELKNILSLLKFIYRL